MCICVFLQELLVFHLVLAGKLVKALDQTPVKERSQKNHQEASIMVRERGRANEGREGRREGGERREEVREVPYMRSYWSSSAKSGLLWK